jgi:hypothetical protein
LEKALSSIILIVIARFRPAGVLFAHAKELLQKTATRLKTFLQDVSSCGPRLASTNTCFD